MRMHIAEDGRRALAQMAPVFVCRPSSVLIVRNAQQGTVVMIAKQFVLVAAMGGVGTGEFANALANGPAQSALCAFVPEDPQGPCVNPTAQHAAGMGGALWQDLVYAMQRGRAQIALWSCAVLA